MKKTEVAKLEESVRIIPHGMLVEYHKTHLIHIAQKLRIKRSRKWTKHNMAHKIKTHLSGRSASAVTATEV